MAATSVGPTLYRGAVAPVTGRPMYSGISLDMDPIIYRWWWSPFLENCRRHNIYTCLSR